MTREQLIDAIMGSDETWTCARNNCNGSGCRPCVEAQVDEYEASIRTEAIEEYEADKEDKRANLLAFICKRYNIPLMDMNCTVEEWEELKEKK